MIRRRVVAQGRVQGVGFRYSVVQRARQRGLGGWVSNRHDGSIEAVFEGDADAVDQLVRFMRDGPRGAAVERIDVSEEEPEGLNAFTLH